MRNNVVAFKKLILLYESITLEDLKEKTPQELTGFGNGNYCPLCENARRIDFREEIRKEKKLKKLKYNNYIAKNYCPFCIWKISKYGHCNSWNFDGKVSRSFEIIREGNFPCRHLQSYRKKILAAFKERAVIMREVLTELGYKQP